MPALEPLVPGRVWTHRAPLRFAGLAFGTRMTVIRLAAGGLFLHSPTTLGPGLAAELAALGAVRFVVAPNRLHHLFVADYFAAYPEARFYCSPALKRKRRDLPWTAVLGDDPVPEWQGEVRHLLFKGSLYLDEVAFLDAPSGTLILTDLIQHHPRVRGPYQRALARLGGVYDRPGVPRDIRLTFWRRGQARACVEEILSWEFARIVIAHGDVITEDAEAVFRRAMGWLIG